MNRQDATSPGGRPPAPLNIAAEILWRVPPSKRRSLVESALTFLPDATLDDSFAVGPLRAVLAAFWEEFTRQPVPIGRLRGHLRDGDNCRTAASLDGLLEANTAEAIVAVLASLVRHLERLEVNEFHRSQFDHDTPVSTNPVERRLFSSNTRSQEKPT